MPTRIKKKILAQLRNILKPGQLLTLDVEVEEYGTDSTKIFHPPELVVLPSSVEQVCRIVKLAYGLRFPVVCRGGGSGFAGGAVPVHGGVVISMEKMNRIIEVNPDGYLAIVEPGVITQDLALEVEKQGLTYPPEPSSRDVSTIGGNLAHNSGGLKSRKYGVTKDYLLGIELVTGRGETLRTGCLSDDEDFCDLTSIIAGSEGTLGIVTKIALRLVRKPKTVSTILVAFDEPLQAAKTIAEINTSGLSPTIMEYIDVDTMNCILEKFDFPFFKRGDSAVLVELDGNAKEVRSDTGEIEKICGRSSPSSYRQTSNVQSREKLWEVRRSISPALEELFLIKVNEDVCVPPSKLPELVEETRVLAAKYGVKIASFGHAGDGNLHVNFLTNRDTAAQRRKIQRAVGELFDITLALRGTISGEHGVGITRRKFFKKQIRPAELELMKSLKRAFDPRGILNPGKIWEE
ncbi:MAG: FAD-binding oxidoreductase [Candidatus Zixiibacteriota bacterium]